jgi:hypothetical protein
MSSEKASTRDHVAEFPTVGTAGTKTFDKLARGSSKLARVTWLGSGQSRARVTWLGSAAEPWGQRSRWRGRRRGTGGAGFRRGSQVSILAARRPWYPFPAKLSNVVAVTSQDSRRPRVTWLGSSRSSGDHE